MMFSFSGMKECFEVFKASFALSFVSQESMKKLIKSLADRKKDRFSYPIFVNEFRFHTGSAGNQFPFWNEYFNLLKSSFPLTFWKLFTVSEKCKSLKFFVRKFADYKTDIERSSKRSPSCLIKVDFHC